MTESPQIQNRPVRDAASWIETLLLYAVFVIAGWIWPVRDLLEDP